MHCEALLVNSCLDLLIHWSVCHVAPVLVLSHTVLSPHDVITPLHNCPHSITFTKLAAQKPGTSSIYK